MRGLPARALAGSQVSDWLTAPSVPVPSRAVLPVIVSTAVQARVNTNLSLAVPDHAAGDQLYIVQLTVNADAPKVPAVAGLSVEGLTYAKPYSSGGVRVSRVTLPDTSGRTVTADMAGADYLHLLVLRGAGSYTAGTAAYTAGAAVTGAVPVPLATVPAGALVLQCAVLSTYPTSSTISWHGGGAEVSAVASPSWGCSAVVATVTPASLAFKASAGTVLQSVAYMFAVGP